MCLKTCTDRFEIAAMLEVSLAQALVVPLPVLFIVYAQNYCQREEVTYETR